MSKFPREGQDIIMTRYLNLHPEAFKEGGDYKKFKMICLDCGLEEEETPSFKTFTRWLKARKPANPTRVPKSAFDDAKNTTEEQLLSHLLEGTVNFDEVEGWVFFNRKKLNLLIDGRVLTDAIDCRIYPPKDTSAATKEIKGFIAGFLYARRSTL